MAEKLGKSLALSLKDSTFVIRAKQLMTVLTTPLPPSKGRCWSPLSPYNIIDHCWNTQNPVSGINSGFKSSHCSVNIVRISWNTLALSLKFVPVMKRNSNTWMWWLNKGFWGSLLAIYSKTVRLCCILQFARLKLRLVELPKPLEDILSGALFFSLKKKSTRSSAIDLFGHLIGCVPGQRHNLLWFSYFEAQPRASTDQLCTSARKG